MHSPLQRRPSAARPRQWHALSVDRLSRSPNRSVIARLAELNYLKMVTFSRRLACNLDEVLEIQVPG